MKVVFIGADAQTAEIAGLSLRLRWPDAKPLVATTALAGLELVEQVSPNVVLLHPTFSDMSLAEAVQALRRFSSVTGCGGTGSRSSPATPITIR